MTELTKNSMRKMPTLADQLARADEIRSHKKGGNVLPDHVVESIYCSTENACSTAAIHGVCQDIVTRIWKRTRYASVTRGLPRRRN
jgi:hypothetical protein